MYPMGKATSVRQGEENARREIFARREILKKESDFKYFLLRRSCCRHKSKVIWNSEYPNDLSTTKKLLFPASYLKE